MPQTKKRQSLKIIIISTFGGAAVFYFLVHPFAMILDSIQNTDTPFNFSLLLKIIKSHLSESFTYSMLSMSVSYIVFGGLLGGVLGLFQINLNKKSATIEKQKNTLNRNILTLIKEGENKYVEFKSSLRYDYRQNSINKELEFVILKTLTGFMNANGGSLIIGVDENGNILGLENDYLSLKQKNKDGFELKIFQLMTEYIDSHASFKINVSFYEFDGNEICLVDIEKSSSPVYLSKEKNNPVFYVRKGNATYPLSVKDAITYIQEQIL